MCCPFFPLSLNEYHFFRATECSEYVSIIYCEVVKEISRDSVLIFVLLTRVLTRVSVL